MIKILSLRKQNDIYKKLINVILELRKNLPDDSAQDALGDAFDIAFIVGGPEMLEALGGQKVKTMFGQLRHGIKEEIGDGLSRGIEFIDDVLGAFE